MIIGSGPAGIGAAEMLRKMQYTGSITIFTTEVSSPIQKHNLTKFTKFKGNENLIMYRNQKFFEGTDIDIFYDTKVVEIKNDINFVSSLQIDNGHKFIYDGLIVASGTGMNQKFLSDKIAGNLVILNSLNDFHKSEKLLKQAKSVIIGSITHESLELASTIMRDYPDIKIRIIEPSNKSYLEDDLGQDISNSLINLFKDKGVNFYFRYDQTNFEFFRFNKRYIKSYKLGKKGQKMHSLKADVIYQFDPNDYLNNKFLFKTPIKFSGDKIQVSQTLRTFEENIFTAGKVLKLPGFGNMIHTNHVRWTDSMVQGQICAYNVLSLKIPYRKPIFSYYNYFGKTL